METLLTKSVKSNLESKVTILRYYVKGALKSRDSDLAALKDKLSRIEYEKEREVKNLTEKIFSLENELATLKATVRDSCEQCDQKTVLIEELNASFKSLEKSKGAEETRLKKHCFKKYKRNMILRKNLAEADQQISENKEEISLKDKQICQKDEQIATLLREYEYLNVQMDNDSSDAPKNISKSINQNKVNVEAVSTKGKENPNSMKSIENERDILNIGTNERISLSDDKFLKVIRSKLSKRLNGKSDSDSSKCASNKRLNTSPDSKNNNSPKRRRGGRPRSKSKNKSDGSNALGTCPTCSKEMTISSLLKHSAKCQGA